MADDLSATAEVLAAWRRGLTPEPLLTVSQWADRHRMLTSRGSSEPGRWRNSRTPYLAEIMDCLSPAHPAQRVVFMKGAQIGGTECGNNWIGYVIQHAPGPMMAVQPTVELAKRFSRQRIDPLLESTPSLRKIVAPARERDSDNTMLSKGFAGGELVMTGANSAVGLRSMSARYLFMDEVDAYPGDVEGEGDPIALALARSRTFGSRKKALLVSTPTIAGQSRIEREYEATDKRRFFVPCPHCQAMQFLEFPRLRWNRGDPASVAYHCIECGAGIPERNKTAMLAAGEWRATAVASDPNAVGFHLSALYSPVGWFSWEAIARDWEATRSLESFAQDRAVKTFRNTVLGETWQEAGDAPDAVALHQRRGRWQMGEVPAGALFIAGACDVQADRLEWDVWAWGVGLSQWLIDSGVILGSATDAATWRALTEVTGRTYKDAAGRPWPIDAFGVDTGYLSQTVYGWTSTHPMGSRIFGLDGRGAPAHPALGTPKKVDVDFGGRKIGAALLWPVGTHALKLEHYAAVKRAIAGPDDDGVWPLGAMHLPDDVDHEYCRQLVSEYLGLVKTRNGGQRREWRKITGIRNERLDTAVYARALAHHLSDHLKPGDWQRLAEKRAADVPAALDDLADHWDGQGRKRAVVIPPQADANAGRRVTGIGRRVT